MKKKLANLTVLAIMAICVSTTVAARKPEATPLTQAGQKLLASYTGQLKTVTAEIAKALPKIDPQKKAIYLKALEAEKVAQGNKDAKEAIVAKSRDCTRLFDYRKRNVRNAIQGIAGAKANLKKVQAMTGDNAKALKDAQAALAKIQANYDMADSELKKVQAAIPEEPRLVKELDVAEKALTLVKAHSMKMIDALGLGSFVATDKIDAKLAKYQILTEATPKGLAEFSQKGQEQKKLIDNLLADTDLMIQMAIAGGARAGKYGQAMKIYTDIQQKSKKAKSGVLQKLAVSISLVHAVPINQLNPVNRYMHFEKAYLNNELDPAFKDLSVWDYRMVINGVESDEIHAWGREMLRNFRPDHITISDYNWRYVAIVQTDIRYGSQYNKCDKADLHSCQNILMNGGICGRRAFFGRFILRSFGIPTIARPQRGHAALAHWTPKGWVVCLGKDWGNGWISDIGSGVTRPSSGRTADTTFLAVTQARMTGKPFEQVWRAQTIIAALGKDNASGTWNDVAIYRRRAIIEDANAITLAAVGTEIGEANEFKTKGKVNPVIITAADRVIVVSNGTITIPAAATSKPTNNTPKIRFMKSNLGGMQLHYSRNRNSEVFEYTFDAPKAGKYALTARVVTPSWKQHLLVKANASNPVDIALPFTIGMWGKTQPVEITLNKGKNVLTFSREKEVTLKGLTIKDFTLSPVN
jgi:hypothetical protein